MPYVLIARDKPDSLATRTANRDAHLAYVAETGVVSFAGPFLTEAGEMCGSLLVLDVPTRAAANEWLVGDPYSRAGLFADTEISNWKKVVG